ncbi:MAG: 4-hydroxy-3-methylbut-2-enyl diphosphate reductase [Pirellulaceae bacterium]
MKIILTSPRGFCAGVNMAVAALETALKLCGAPLYVYHEIVHNKHIVERFRRLGVVFVDHVDEVPAGARLMYSAHGISPEVQQAARERGLRIIDATCPLVRKVHLQAVRFAQQGYTIVLVGHEGHDEVVGVLGEAPSQIVLVESVEDVDHLDLPPSAKVAYLTQTTLSVDEANKVLDRLKQRYPAAVGSPKEDICYATQNRQEALKAILGDVDVVLVVGSQNSSNSMRLAEIALEAGVPSYLIDGPQDIDLQWFSGEEFVGLTAGASAPEDLVSGCIELLQQQFGATLEERSVREEHTEFHLPSELREMLAGAGA